jgi:hypothetical protein
MPQKLLLSTDPLTEVALWWVAHEQNCFLLLQHLQSMIDGFNQQWLTACLSCFAHVVSWHHSPRLVLFLELRSPSLTMR